MRFVTTPSRSLATALIALALAPASAGAMGLDRELQPGRQVTWHHRCFLGDAKVDGKHGRWTNSLPGYVWGRRGRIQFNGIQFYNGSSRTIRVTAHCPRHAENS